MTTAVRRLGEKTRAHLLAFLYMIGAGLLCRDGVPNFLMLNFPKIAQRLHIAER
jgi:hypothetical protein